MTWAHPIDPAVLADYWLAELSEAEESGVEEHLFECEECSGHMQSMAQLAVGIRGLARQGNLPLIVTGEFLDRLEQAGFHVRQYAVPAGGAVQCTVTAQDDFLIGRLAADLTGIQRLDLAMCDASGAERQRLRDIPFRAARGEVIFNYPIAVARRLGPDVLVMRLLAIAGSDERVVGEYKFNHTPT